MVRAWYLNETSADDNSLPDHRTPPSYISMEQLTKIVGMEFMTVDPDDPNSSTVFDRLKRDNNCPHEDEVLITEPLPEFRSEHLHEDREFRFVVDGGGYFDVRDPSDAWIRLHIEKGDIFVVPAGLYHRFTFDEKNFLKVRRCFEKESWVAYNRPSADQMECRKKYVSTFEGMLESV